MIRVVVFDFDDTLVRSERAKEEAYVEVFHRLPGAETHIRRYLAASRHQHGNRSEKIAGIIDVLSGARLLDPAVKDRLVAQYVTDYTRYVEDVVAASPEVEGATAALRALASGRALYVNSGTPQESLDRIVERRKMRALFRGIYGSPPGTKTEHLDEILVAERAAPTETVVVGDSVNDYDSARAHGCHFVGIRGDFTSLEELGTPQHFLESLQRLPMFIGGM